MSLYSLTHLTGRKRNTDRKIIIATVETSKAGFLVSAAAAVVSIIPTAVAAIFFGSVVIVIVPPLCIVVALVLFRQQSSKGLHLPMYRMLLDKSAAKKTRGQILICGVPIEQVSSVGSVSYSSEPAVPTDEASEQNLSPAAYGVTAPSPEPRTESSAIWS